MLFAGGCVGGMAANGEWEAEWRPGRVPVAILPVCAAPPGRYSSCKRFTDILSPTSTFELCVEGTVCPPEAQAVLGRVEVAW